MSHVFVLQSISVKSYLPQDRPQHSSFLQFAHAALDYTTTKLISVLQCQYRRGSNFGFLLTPPHPRSRYLKEEAPFMHWLKTRWFYSSQSNVYFLILARFFFFFFNYFSSVATRNFIQPPDCSLSARTLKCRCRQSWDKSSYCSTRQRVHDLWNIWRTMRKGAGTC